MDVKPYLPTKEKVRGRVAAVEVTMEELAKTISDEQDIKEEVAAQRLRGGEKGDGRTMWRGW